MIRRLLDRKLRRDLRSHLGSLVAIAIVVACGVAAFVAERSVSRVLSAAQADYYVQVRFPDLFAHVRRAPDAAVERLKAVRGIARLETRTTGEVVLRLPGLREPASALIVGTRTPASATLNHVVLSAGRRPFDGERDAAIVSQGFATANAIVVGDTLGAVIGDRWRTLRVVGIGVTAEFVYELRAGEMLPDPRRYGVIWLDADAAADALGYTGAWNDLAVSLAPDADTLAVIDALDAELARFGSLGAYGRSRHASHLFVTEEIRQNQTFALVLPAILLGVAAFLVHLVLGRVVTQQRDQVGTLKAFGFPPSALVRHYALFALVPVLAGTVLGAGLGLWLARGLTGIYEAFFRFPSLQVGIYPIEIVMAAVIAVASGLAGALGALRRLLTLPAAQAMRPEAPAAYAHGLTDRLLAGRIRSPVARMIVRGLAHQPVRTVLGAVGIGLGAAVVVGGTFGFDAVDRMREIMFSRSSHADVNLVLAEAQGIGVLDAIAAMPGVTRVEPVREVAVRVRHGHLSRQTALTGVEPDAQLRRIVDLEARIMTIADDGLTLGASLGRALSAGVGDTVDIEFLDGRARRVSLRVAATVADIAGLGAYVPASRLPALVGVGDLVTGADLAVHPDSVDALYDELAHAPAVRAVNVKKAMRSAFDATLRQNFLIVLVTLVVFASVLSAGTVYNAGRVTLSERARDLASLRVLGFTRGEVARMLFGELAVLAAVGLPFGLLVGVGFTAATVAAFGNTELFRLPLVIGPRSLAAGFLLPLIAGIVAAVPLKKTLDRLDLISVLKTRE
ncbi:MAG: FtsX-like permease family protein [Gemmatimonadetes bacterium]|nr:FtsX-like permease family protein [Gemmatimonadota bacterium]